MSQDLPVARTILSQLGGRMFVALTGSTHFVGDATSLSFRVGENPKAITHAKVNLQPDDTYTLVFQAYHPKTHDIIHEETLPNVYCDQLKDIFEDRTGLYVSLHPRT